MSSYFWCRPLKQLADDIGMPLKILDLGGGLGIDYLQQGKTLFWQLILTDLAIIKEQAGAEELWLELGRFAVAECGYYVVLQAPRSLAFSTPPPFLILYANPNTFGIY